MPTSAPSGSLPLAEYSNRPDRDSVVPNENRHGVRRVAVAFVEVRLALLELVAFTHTSAGNVINIPMFFPHMAHAPRAAAEADVFRGGKAVRVWCVEARRASSVYRTRAAANLIDALAAIRNSRVQCLARDEPSRRVNAWDGLTDEGKLGIGGFEPVDHLVLGQDVGGDPGLATESLVSNQGKTNK